MGSVVLLQGVVLALALAPAFARVLARVLVAEVPFRAGVSSFPAA
ncbi:hypothetical protein [Nocardiopsis nanhaiensis]